MLLRRAAALPWLVALVWLLAFAPPALLAQQAGGDAPADGDAGGDERPLAAVLELETVEAGEAEGTALSDRLREALLKTGRFKLVDRSQLERILAEQELQQTTCTGTDCAVEVGRLLGADEMITGKVVKLGRNTWQVSAQRIDVASAETLKADSILHEGRLVDLLREGMPALASKLAGAEGEAPAAAVPAPEEEPPRGAVSPGAVSPREAPPPEEPEEPSPPKPREQASEAPAREPVQLRLFATPLSAFSMSVDYTRDSDGSTLTDDFSGTGVSLGADVVFDQVVALGLSVHAGELDTIESTQDGETLSLSGDLGYTGSYNATQLSVSWVIPVSRFQFYLGGGLHNAAVDVETPGGDSFDATLTGLGLKFRVDYTFPVGFFLGLAIEAGTGTAEGSIPDDRESKGFSQDDASTATVYVPLGWSF